MKLNKAYKIRIYPNQQQKTVIEQTFGCTRFIWNQMLNYKRDLYAARQKSYSKFDSIKDIAEIKKIEGYEWLKDVDSIALQQSMVDLDIAYQNFFKHSSGFPKFKRKHGNGSYRTNNVNSNVEVNFSKKRIKLPKLGLVKFRDRRVFADKVRSVTVSTNATGQYFASILIEFEFEPKLPLDIADSKVFSADMSAKKFMVSGEIEFENQKFYRANERKLQIRSRRFSRTTTGSNNRNKARLNLARVHRDITNQRRGYQRNVANMLVKQFDVLCFEDLNIEAMKKFNSGLSKTVSMDFSWSEFLTFLEWKCLKENKHFVKISRWFPSSKMCNVCGSIKEDLTLNDRTYKCDCGNVADRDQNAAKNIKEAGLNQLQKLYEGVNLLNKPTGLMPESYACGDTMTEVTWSAQESMSFRA